jgi:hypothetical protein
MGWEERPPKIVGRQRPLTPGEALAWNAAMLRLSPLCGQWFPKGVFKFRTWEEEESWTREQIARARQRRK